MIENTILSSLVYNEDFARKTIPYIKKEYFARQEDQLIFEVIDDFIKKYNKLPSREILVIELSNKSVNEETFKNSIEIIESYAPNNENSIEWLLENTEKYCQDRAIYNAIRESIQILDAKSTKDKGSIPKILEDALSVSFDTNIGHDYSEDFERRFDFYTKKENKIKFDIDILNKITKGGLSKKTLNIFLAGTGAGKSMFMCHCAAANILDGKNVLYITLEMSEEEISRRIDANILDVDIGTIEDLPRDTFLNKFKKIKEKIVGKLVVKEFPNSTAHSGHFRYLINELKLKKNFIPDIIYVDYLNLCASARLKAGSNINSYTYVKAIAEELRAIGIEFDVPVVSATQVTRSGYGSSDIDLTDTSESFGLPATADFMAALIVSEEMEKLGQMMIKQLKNRYGDLNYFQKFIVGIERRKMRFFNSDANEINNDNEKPVFDKTGFGEAEHEKSNKFKNLKF